MCGTRNWPKPNPMPLVYHCFCPPLLTYNFFTSNQVNSSNFFIQTKKTLPVGKVSINCWPQFLYAK